MIADSMKVPLSSRESKGSSGDPDVLPSFPTHTAFLSSFSSFEYRTTTKTMATICRMLKARRIQETLLKAYECFFLAFSSWEK